MLLLMLLFVVFVEAQPFRKPKFERLTLGAIEPAGWTRDMLDLQAQGLAGHLRWTSFYVYEPFYDTILEL